EVAEYVADNWADVESHRDAGREQLVDHLKTRHQKARDAAAARATAECARLIAADVLMGMPYSAEELADENDDTAPAPKTRKI
ncbi:hypothetical protein KBZ21_40115, partial [Streptomyces sp. A73]|nr:hypothetical protein [Streptomyces sp. A73]